MRFCKFLSRLKMPWAFLLVVVGFSCGGEQQPEEQLVMAVNAGIEAESLKAATLDYERVTGIRVRVVEFPYQSLFEKLSLAMTRDSSPYDLVMIDDPWFPGFAEQGVLSPLQPFYDSKGEPGPDADFIEPCLALCRFPYSEGELFALPYVGNAQLFFYRKDLFEKHQLSAPSSWDEVLTSGGKIGQAEGLFGYVMRAAQGNAIVADFMPLFWAYGAEMFDGQGRPRVDSPEALRALEMMLRLGEISPPGYVNFNADEVGAHLLQSTAVTAINWPAWIPAFEDPARSKVVGKIGFSTMPSATHPGASAIGNWLLAIPTGSGQKEKAFEFLVWATGSEQMKLSAERGNPPTRHALFRDQELLARFPAYPVQYSSLLGSRPRPRSPVWNEIENAFGIHLSQANAGLHSPQEALSKAQAEIEAILARWEARRGGRP